MIPGDVCKGERTANALVVEHIHRDHSVLQCFQGYRLPFSVVKVCLQNYFSLSTHEEVLFVVKVTHTKFIILCRHTEIDCLCKPILHSNQFDVCVALSVRNHQFFLHL